MFFTNNDYPQPLITRVLIVVVFVEDCIRLVQDHSFQLEYFTRRLHYSYSFSLLFLIVNFLLEFVGASLVLLSGKLGRTAGALGCALLLVDLPLQLIVYQHFADVTFSIGFASLSGSVLILLSEYLPHGRAPTHAGLPTLSRELYASDFAQLLGRLLLIVLFASIMMRGEAITMARVVASLTGVILSVCVAVGFRARMCAMIIVVAMGIANVAVNSFWRMREHDPRRDLVKYDFFIACAVMGGFWMLARVGPGSLAVDAKKDE